ncbi:MAG: FAD-dependent oxidoreductase, partial [Candidatus Latescibacteria bacterium]|nr:FAD-dependent oxidoreductase [Candidatus Latescibacterota bacterium]
MAVKKVKKKKRKIRSGSGASKATMRPRHIEKTPPCRHRCPSGNRVREFVTTLAQAEHLGKSLDQAFEEAWETVTETSPFPAVCGRVCPHPCEIVCNRKDLDTAVNINEIERAIGDFGLEKGLKLKALSDAPQQEQVAVVGAGPGGLSCAYQLARRGYPVTVYEASEKPGGLLRYGIPSFRLPEAVLDGEIQKILDLGVELKCDTRIGDGTSLDDLRSQYQAVFVSIGAERGMKLGVAGEEAENVVSGVDLLGRINRGEQVDVGDKVVVVGGDNRALDAARACRRLGAEVTVVFGDTLEKMPAMKELVQGAQEEGLTLECLVAAVGFKKDGDRVTGVECVRMELGEPDGAGNRQPVTIVGSQFEIPVTAVVPGIGQEPNNAGFESLVNGSVWIQADKYGASERADDVFAGGDAIGLGYVTTAIGQGRQAAESIDLKLRGLPREEEPLPPMILWEDDRMGLRLDGYEEKARARADTLAVGDRLSGMDAEVRLPMSSEQVVEESSRCMSCGFCSDCEKC